MKAINSEAADGSGDVHAVSALPPGDGLPENPLDRRPAGL